MELSKQAALIGSVTYAAILTAVFQSPYPDSAFTADPHITTAETSESYSGIFRSLPSEDDIKLFRALADQWRQDTMDTSSLTEMVSHPAYLAIIGMSSVATPLLLNELAKNPSHWFVALEAINRLNPVPAQDAGNFKKMTAAWLSWGRKIYDI